MSLKKFEILEMVAKGGMAEVYRAKTVGFQGFEKEVCVKKILPHLTEDDSFVTMFINEAKLAATLSYANIVSVHDLCVSAGGEYFIVMEYIHGKDLSDVIRAAQLAGKEVPIEIAVYILREVCKGLHYAHTKTDMSGAPLNIIHRDISPHNVLVSLMGEVKITDFGIAKASSIMNKTAVGILKGKYGYMSPEQARGQPLDHRSDIFNAGIVLYELLVGERCFAGSSDFSTLNLMRNAVVTPPTKINTKIPKELEGIVLRALSADRNDRYRDALELESALAAFASKTRPVGAPEVGAFMKELFANNEPSRNPGETGVLSLASVVGPAAEKPKDARAAGAPKSEPPVGGGEVGKEALERAKKRAKKEPEPAAAPAPEASPAEKPREKPAAKGKEAREAKDDAAEKAKEEKKPAALAETREEGAAQEALAKDPAPAEAKEPKPEKKPARLKAEAKDEAGEEKGKKGGGKQLSDTPKKPVGRRDLRPGLTHIHRMGRPSPMARALRATFLLTLALGVGAGFGVYRTHGVSGERTFREIELKTRDPALGDKKPTVTLVISSDPPGATVVFDKNELSDRTPLVLERDRDDAEHELELVLAGHEPVKKKVRYESGPVTHVSEPLGGQPGTLKVVTKPADVPVRVDGKPVGKSPISIELPAGEREVEIGGEAHEVLKAKIELKAGKVAKLEKNVALKGEMASIRIFSDPQAQIMINDVPTGVWTNDQPLPLEADVAHRISLSLGDKKARSEMVLKLKEGEKRSLFVDLSGSTGS